MKVYLVAETAEDLSTKILGAFLDQGLAMTYVLEYSPLRDDMAGLELTRRDNAEGRHRSILRQHIVWRIHDDLLRQEIDIDYFEPAESANGHIVCLVASQVVILSKELQS